MSFQCHQRGACRARAACDTVFATNPTTATPTREIGSRTTSLIHKTLSAQPPVSESPTSWRRASSRSGSLTRTRRRHPQRDWSSSCPARRRWLRTGRGGQAPSPTKPSTSSGARHSSGQPARPRLNQARPCHSSAEDDAQKVECAPRALFHTTEMITRRRASSRPTRTAPPHRSTPHARKAAPDRRHPRPWSGAATTTSEARTTRACSSPVSNATWHKASSSEHRRRGSRRLVPVPWSARDWRRLLPPRQH